MIFNSAIHQTKLHILEDIHLHFVCQFTKNVFSNYIVSIFLFFLKLTLELKIKFLPILNSANSYLPCGHSCAWNSKTILWNAVCTYFLEMCRLHLLTGKPDPSGTGPQTLTFLQDKRLACNCYLSNKKKLGFLN